MRKKLTRHHRKCKSNGGTDLPTNISMVPESHHRAWHILFGNKGVEQIVELLNDVWVDPYYKVTYERREVQFEIQFPIQRNNAMGVKEHLSFYNH